MFCTGQFDPNMMLVKEHEVENDKKAEEAELIKQTQVKVPKVKKIDLEKYDESIKAAITFLTDRKKERCK